MKQQAQVTEVERTACTMLQTVMDQLFESAVKTYVKRIVSDPEYTDLLSSVLYHSDSAYKLAMDYLIHKAAVELASSVAQYRGNGRPIGDRTTDIGGGFSISSSLAANIVEFHQAVLNAYCVNADEQEDARA